MNSKDSKGERKLFIFLVVKNNVRKGIIASQSLKKSRADAYKLFDYVCRYSNKHLDVVQLHRINDDGTETSVVKHWGGRPSWFEGVRKEVCDV